MIQCLRRAVPVRQENDVRPMQAAGWRRELRTRLVTLWPVKALASTLGISLFFYGYFWVMRHPLGAVTVMPLTWVDGVFNFMPASFAAYVSLWVYVVAGPALARDRRELTAIGIASAALSLAGFVLFLVVPTEVPPAAVDWSLHPSMQFLKSVDVSGNACPSLHVAFAVFTALVVSRQLAAIGAPRWLEVINLLWCLAIVHSTLATRQHVAWDVLAGAALALPATLLHHRAAGWPLRRMTAVR